MAKGVGRILGLLLLLLAGCDAMFGRQGLPADPLFSNGKPAESRVQAGPPTPPPFSEPGPPVNKTAAKDH